MTHPATTTPENRLSAAGSAPGGAPRPRAGNIVALPLSARLVAGSARAVASNAPHGRRAAINRLATAFAGHRTAAGWPADLVEAVAAEYRLQVLAAAVDILREEERA